MLYGQGTYSNFSVQPHSLDEFAVNNNWWTCLYRQCRERFHKQDTILCWSHHRRLFSSYLFWRWPSSTPCFYVFVASSFSYWSVHLCWRSSVVGQLFWVVLRLWRSLNFKSPNLLLICETSGGRLSGRGAVIIGDEDAKATGWWNFFFGRRVRRPPPRGVFWLTLKLRPIFIFTVPPNNHFEIKYVKFQ